MNYEEPIRYWSDYSNKEDASFWVNDTITKLISHIWYTEYRQKIMPDFTVTIDKDRGVVVVSVHTD